MGCGFVPIEYFHDDPEVRLLKIKCRHRRLLFMSLQVMLSVASGIDAGF